MLTQRGHGTDRIKAALAEHLHTNPAFCLSRQEESREKTADLVGDACRDSDSLHSFECERPIDCAVERASNRAPKADAATDNTEVFQKRWTQRARRAAASSKSCPAASASTVRSQFPAGVTLQGTYRVPPTAASQNEAPEDRCCKHTRDEGRRKGRPSFGWPARTPRLPGWS